MASSLSTIVAKDGTPTTIAGGILAVDKSGGGLGPFAPAHALIDTQGVNTATVKAASTAVAAIDTAVAVGLHPTSPLPAGTNALGSVIISNANTNVQGGAPVTVGAVLPTAVANGATSSRVNSAASTNATSLKPSAGQGYNIDVFNVAAYTVFLKLYNKVSAPTVGTDVPIWTIPVPASGGYSKFFALGKTFSTGIAYAITKLQADSDTTAVAAGDLTGSIDWI